MIMMVSAFKYTVVNSSNVNYKMLERTVSTIREVQIVRWVQEPLPQAGEIGICFLEEVAFFFFFF